MRTPTLLATLAALMLVVTNYPAVAKDRAGTRFAGLVDIGNDREMYLECIGTGSPTVVLVSGFRGAHDDWTHVIDPADPTGNPVPTRSAVFFRVSAFARVCAYDRPGTTEFGGTLSDSSFVPQPTSAGDGAADLRALLRAAGEPGPYVVVAHSWGGLMARLFASQNPDEVAGLVLLDPGSEFLESSLTPEQWATFVQGARTLGEPRELEAADYEPSVAALRAARPVRAIPVVLLTSDKPFDFGAGGGDTWPAWLAAQEGVATLLDARHVTRTNSGHFIQGEQPKLVVKAIRQVIEAACRTVDCPPVSPGQFAGKAERVGDGAEKGKITFSGKVPAAGTLDLRAATVTVTALLREIGGGELVRGGGGAPFLPVTLEARRGSKATGAIFETPPGVRPSVEIEVKQRDPKKGEVEFSLKVDRATIPVAPKRCDPRGGNAVRLGTSIAIADSNRKALEVNPELSWRCGRNELRTP